jgi:capsule biosynthesis phosphatase
MIAEDKVIVIDLDNTLCQKKDKNTEYKDLLPKQDVLDVLRQYKGQGFHIIISTSRNMRSYQGNIGQINANTAPIIVDWLSKHQVPYDELHFGKPWCGHKGFYVDDKSIRPDEFTSLSYEEIMERISDDDQ